MVTLSDAEVGQEATISEHFKVVGGVAFEGITSNSDWLLAGLSDRRAANELGGEKPGLGNPIRSGGMLFGGNNRADYGFAQKEAERWLLNLSAIPGLKIPPIATGLETRSDDEVALPFYGPQIAGQARTGKVPQWVGDYLGCQVVKDDKGNMVWRLYLTEYRGEDGFPHKYKTRGWPKSMPPYLEDASDTEPFTQFNLGIFWDFAERARGVVFDRISAAYPDAPGVAEATPLAVKLAPAPDLVPVAAVAEVVAKVAAVVASAVAPRLPGPPRPPMPPARPRR
jgi:hypothetical protein